jgi:alginate O-acetyltransferase complex protein AlgF
MRARILLAVLLPVFITFQPPAVHAVEEGALYAEEAPPGSAFVRVFNGFPGSTAEHVVLGGKSIKALSPLESSAYVYLPPGRHSVKVEDNSQSLAMREGEFYTVIIGEKFPLTVIQDQPFTNRRKALLSVYNLVSKEAVDLKTADGAISLIEDVGFLANKSREINPVRLSVLATAGDASLGQSNPVSLQWGKVFSLFACGESARPKLVWVESKIDTSL